MTWPRRTVIAALPVLLAAPAAAQTRPAQRTPARSAPPPPVAIPPPPVPAPADPQAQMARDALADVARFLLGRGGHLGPGDGSGGATQEQLDNALADIEVARQIAEVYDLADLRLALAAYDAVAQLAPLTRHRAFEFEALVTNSGRIFPALNAATDAIDRAYPAERGAGARRAVLADASRAADPALPLPVLVAAAVAKAASHAPFVALEIMERCGRAGERSMSRGMLVALGLAAPDIYDFFLRNFVDSGGPQSRAAFIRNVRGAAARCAR